MPWQCVPNVCFWTMRPSGNAFLVRYSMSFRQYCVPEWSGMIAEQQILYTVKKGSDFPVPSRTNQTLPGQEKFNYSWPGRVWLVPSRLGTGKSLTFFTVYAPRMAAFWCTLGHLTGRYVRCPPAAPYPHCAPFLSSHRFFKFIYSCKERWTYQGQNTSGRIVQATNRPMSESSNEWIDQWVNRPIDESSDGRIVQTIGDKKSVGNGLKLHQSQGRVFITKVLSFVHIQYNTEWPISHVLVCM